MSMDQTQVCMPPPVVALPPGLGPALLPGVQGRRLHQGARVGLHLGCYAMVLFGHALLPIVSKPSPEFTNVFLLILHPHCISVAFLHLSWGVSWYGIALTFL